VKGRRVDQGAVEIEEHEAQTASHRSTLIAFTSPRVSRHRSSVNPGYEW
jgi:hypothetical protein